MDVDSIMRLLTCEAFSLADAARLCGLYLGHQYDA